MPREVDIRHIEVVDDATAAMLRTKTPVERMKLGFETFEFAVRMMSTGVRHAQPTWNDAQVQAEVFRRMKGAAAG